MRATAGLILIAALLPSPGAVAALEGGVVGKPAKGGVFPEPTDASDEEAKVLLGALKAAGADGAKDAKKLVDAIAPMVTKRHKDFVPELKKLLADRRDPVSAEAAHALASQGDKSASPLLLKVLNAKTRDKEGFLRDPETKAAAAEALGRLGEAKAAESVRELLNDLRGTKEVHARYARFVAKGCVRFFGLVKDKEAVSFLIDEVEQPAPKDPNSNTNPGADYWKARYDIWAEIRAEVVWALKEITGREFESNRRWENWFREEGRKAGFK